MRDIKLNFVCQVIKLTTLFVAILFFIRFSSVFAIDPIAELESEKNELAHLLELSAAATTPLEKEVSNLDQRIKSAQQSIRQAQAETTELAKNIAASEVGLVGQYRLFAERVAAGYRRRARGSPLLIFLNAADAADFTRNYIWQQRIETQDQQLLTAWGQKITDLEQRKANLAQSQQRLAKLASELDQQAEFFRREIKGAKDYQQQLSQKIAALTARQQEILAARSGSYTTSVGEVPLADDFNASIAFKAQAPANSFAVFSFGAFTHRNGMSQYGAKARAETGQSVEEILKAYYPNAELRKDYQVPGQISVQGYGNMPFEDQYLQGIAEMPSSWPLNALKAQAIAARTFALRYTNNGQKSICITEACQVFRNSRKGGDWEKAVNETRGWVLTEGGQPISSQYASTHGGYANTCAWDTTDKNGGGDWSSRAWEQKANSPWFYKSWYTQAYSVNSAKCGRSHPWLSETEFADIINAWIVRSNPNGADVNRIQPVTINDCPVGGSGGQPYSMDELRNLANNSGGAVTSVSSVSVSHSGSGQTTLVRLVTNRGIIEIAGTDFKTTFNLRAPGYLAIPQKSFAFFNIEYKK